MNPNIEIASYFHLDEEAIDILDPDGLRRYEQQRSQRVRDQQDREAADLRDRH